MNKKYVVAISFANYLKDKSGIPKVMMAHQQMYNQKNISYVSLFSVKKNICNDKIMLFCKFGLIIDGSYKGIYQMSQIIEMFAQYEKEKKQLIDIHLHHLMYINSKRIEELLDACNDVPIKVYLHDYYTVCMQYTLLNEGKYCGGKGLNKDNCADCMFFSRSLIVEKKNDDLFKKYKDRILFISPSISTKDIFLRFRPDYKEQVMVIPHQKYNSFYRGNLENIESEDVIRVAFLGMPRMHKGWKVWDNIVKNSDRNCYEFVVFNSSKDVYPLMTKREVFFKSDDLNAMTHALREYKVHAVVLWSIWPETYSYTCFEAFSANAFIITNYQSGNIADVVRNNKNGIILRDDNELMNFFSNKEKVRIIINEFRKRTMGGPDELFENDAIVELSLKENVGMYIKRKRKIVNYPLIWLLNVLYKEDRDE